MPRASIRAADPACAPAIVKPFSDGYTNVVLDGAVTDDQPTVFEYQHVV